MLIEVTSSGRLALHNADDFTCFSVRVDPLAARTGLDLQALSRLGRLDGASHVWVEQSALQDMAGLRRDTAWDDGLARMVSYAHSKGWVDEQGRIRAHIESTETITRSAVSAEDFKAAMRNLAGGVALVTTGQGEGRRGLTVTAVTSVSADPPTVIVCVNSSSSGHDAIVQNGVFGVSMLGPHHEALANRFAGRDGLKGAERFAGEAWNQLATGVPLLASALSALDCEIVARHAIGSHSLIIGRVVGTSRRDGDPLVNFQGRMQTLALT